VADAGTTAPFASNPNGSTIGHYRGMPGWTDRQVLEPSDLVGHTLTKVAARWFYFADEPRIVHLWLTVDGVGTALFRGYDEVELTVEDPVLDDKRNDPEEGTPEALAAIVGARIEGIVPLRHGSGSDAVGFVIETRQGAVGIVDIVDDVLVGPWPDDPRWAQAGVVAK
jgi:hypothetical protein